MAELNDLKVNGDLEITGTLTAQNAVVTGLDGLTATVSELNFMDGVTSNVQAQLNSKASSSHTHSNYATSDHTHSGYAASSHTHSTMGSSSDYNQISVRNYTGTPTLNSGDNRIYFQEDWTNNYVTVGINGKGAIGVNHAATAAALSSTLPVKKGGTGATTFTSGAALIGAGTGAVTTRAITNNTSKTYCGINTNLVTVNTLAYWNGGYNSSGASNLSYCNRGAFGTIVTKNTGDYATSSHSHSLSSLGAKFTTIVANGSATTSATWTNNAFDFLIGCVRPASSNTPTCFSISALHCSDLQITDEVQCTVWSTTGTGMTRKSGSGTIFGLWGVNVV